MVLIAEIVGTLYYAWRLNQLERWEKRQGKVETRNIRGRQSIDLAAPRLPQNDKEVEHIWNFYVELGLMERHFDQIQSNYRRLASTWLLAAFAAIGFVLSTKMTPLIPPELFILALGIAGSVGVYLIWVIDLLVNQRLLDANIIQARDLETAHKWLPQVRNNMRMLLRGKGLRLKLWFYIAGTEVAALAGGVGLLLWLRTTSTPVDIICLITVDYVVGMFLVLMLMHAKTTITPHLEQQIRHAKGGAKGGNH
jgi:hypothetical protein